MPIPKIQMRHNTVMISKSTSMKKRKLMRKMDLLLFLMKKMICRVVRWNHIPAMKTIS